MLLWQRYIKQSHIHRRTHLEHTHIYILQNIKTQGYPRAHRKQQRKIDSGGGFMDV